MSATKGFTLIELMVAIAIMAVVFGVIITSSSAVKQGSRDTTRKSDLAKIQTALEEYHADQISYPSGTLSSGDSISSGGHTYLSSIPADPSQGTATPYCYTAFKADGVTTGCDNTDPSQANHCQSYGVYAQLENPPTSPPPPSYSCGGNTYNYSVGPQ